ncbi:SWPV2-ORF025 [Shearwaterpox virus]|uniref:SWPV2-ORF025 n=1 Tax=Shearwaterpox virus TaxID=1974596 RepID=A0A1V0QFY4_CNPV|nr:SWPV2-ORF025 [Shearwaterpox virus]QRM15658.1 c-type lectin-like protein [Penguinpox virus 2]QRM15988.1 c-type lectin-like protein [Albatrosspox virus]
MGLNIYITCISILLSYTLYNYYYEYSRDNKITYLRESCHDNWVRHSDKCYFASLHKVNWKDGFDRCNLIGAKMLNNSILSEDRIPVILYKNHWLDKTGSAIFVKDEDYCEFVNYDNKKPFISTTSCNSSMFYVCVSDIMRLL